ncbi:MAG TPA: hypothetical protein ENJ82_04920, partial [Bacteroidetes bacterium]|nr:hypothetical protein [Bacteroidota bacterium]
MLKSLAERILNWLKPVKKPEKNQWVTVSISFILAVTLWFLVTLNTQSFSRYYSIPVKLSNFPEDLQLTREFPSQMRVLAKGVGIDLLYQQFESQDTLTINFNNFKDRREF